jgi:hypothetical protein
MRRDPDLTHETIQDLRAVGAALTHDGRSTTMIRKHSWSTLALGALALAVWGCSEAGPTDPTDATAPVSFARATTVTGYTSSTDPALLEWYTSEKVRVAADSAAEKSTYDGMVALYGPERKWLNQASKGGVAECYPQPFASDVQIIGPEGGKLVIGAHTYTVPSRALSKYYVITGEAHVGTAVAVQFAPEGLGFAKQTLLQLSYAECAFPSGATKQVAFTDSFWNIKEYEPSTDDVLNQILGGYVVHFSQYAVAW